MHSLVLLLAAVLPASFVLGIGDDQAVAVKGVLYCHDQPAKNTLVKLYDIDEPDMDDLLDKKYTDDDGSFFLSGYETEASRCITIITSIDAQLNIYTDCEDDWTPCQRKISIKIPDKYITKGQTAKKVFDAGQLNLAGKFRGETRDCLHFLRISHRVQLNATAEIAANTTAGLGEQNVTSPLI
ncbi:hypothetical protein M3Y99_00679400 [Aphelenchoides fujianensis]|nr:hypothetical protein M3Y99_00679400 [Aphelenchoides fujianensis]